MARRSKGKDQNTARPKIVTVIPAYNEERFIGSVVLKARKFASYVIVVDDGSVDTTGEIAEAAGALVIRHETNRGKSQALNTGFHKCREMDPDVVITLDGDAQHMPEEIPSIIAPIINGEADVVVGSRYIKNTSRVPWQRVLGHRLTTYLTNLASGVRVTDSQSGFRAFSARALHELIFQSGGFSVESEMQFLIQESQLKIVEVPITIRYADKPKRPVLSQGLSVLNGILNLVGQHHPLLFFGLSGMLVMLVGLGWGLWVIEIYRRSLVLAVGYALISVILTFLGSLSVITGIILHAIRGQLMEIKETLLRR